LRLILTFDVLIASMFGIAGFYENKTDVDVMMSRPLNRRPI